MKPYLALVTWEDASSANCAGYCYTQKEYSDLYEPYLIDSVGFILRADKNIVILSNWRTRPAFNHDEDFRGCTRIPRGMVRSIKRLK
jgi:hypothetical protein